MGTYGVGRVDGSADGAPNVLMLGSDERGHFVNDVKPAEVCFFDGPDDAALTRRRPLKLGAKPACVAQPR